MGVSNASPWGSWIQAQDANNNATSYPLLLNPNGGRIGVGTAKPGEGQVQINITAAGDSNYSAIALNLTNDSTDSDTGVSLRFSPGNIDTALRGSYITSLISGANGSDLQFWTCANGFAPTERMSIGADGRISMAHDGSYYNAGETLSVSASDNGNTHVGRNTNASFSNNLIFYYTSRAGSTAFDFLKLSSNAASDTEYRLRGDGQAYADGAWNGGGADYAEYFEWSDGNTSAEDRRGISVVLVDDKIREAVAGEEPIGVISGNPSVVGDTDIDRWKHKYLRDDYGSYVWEDYEVEDEDGNTVVQQRRQINPAWNSENEYVSREDRPEWDTVGLMGKLRIRKGQVTGTRWIKMRDVSDTVEEWLVR